MIEELQASEDAGERVMLIGHISPGSGDMIVDQVSRDVEFGLY